MHAQVEAAIIELIIEVRADFRQLREEIRMATIALQRLIDAVTNEKTEIDSALAFIKGVPQMIRDAVAAASTAGQTTEQAMNDLAAQIEVETGVIQTALAANTPSAPAPATPPATTPPPADSGTPTTSGEGTPTTPPADASASTANPPGSPSTTSGT